MSTGRSRVHLKGMLNGVSRGRLGVERRVVSGKSNGRGRCLMKGCRAERWEGEACWVSNGGGAEVLSRISSDKSRPRSRVQLKGMLSGMPGFGRGTER